MFSTLTCRIWARNSCANVHNNHYLKDENLMEVTLWNFPAKAGVWISWNPIELIDDSFHVVGAELAKMFF